jgi:hypothetical protein
MTSSTNEKVESVLDVQFEEVTAAPAAAPAPVAPAEVKAPEAAAPAPAEVKAEEAPAAE